MPLVPEPFNNVSLSTQAVSSKNPPMARTWARFCPNLNIVQYREALSEEKKTELDRRADKLTRRACANHLYKSSEFGWEVCSWFDTFGLIMDDRALRMLVPPSPIFGLVAADSTNTSTATGIRGHTSSCKRMTVGRGPWERGFLTRHWGLQRSTTISSSAVLGAPSPAAKRSMARSNPTAGSRRTDCAT